MHKYLYHVAHDPVHQDILEMFPMTIQGPRASQEPEYLRHLPSTRPTCSGHPDGKEQTQLHNYP